MDNDTLRRGKPSTHIKFGESTAILAGNSLLTLAFEIIADKKFNIDTTVKLNLIKKLSECAGHSGIAGGQFLDLNFEKKRVSKRKIINMQLNKTGKLFSFSTIAPLIIANKFGKINQFKKIGLDIVLIIPFDKEFSLMSAQMFADTVLKDLFNPTIISVGKNHYFGHKKEGDFEFLKAFCSDNNIELHTPVMREHMGNTISSSLIRSLILDGNSSKVYDYLGRFYGFNATVVSGSNRGKTMNYPTANFIPIFENQLLPSTGVYLTRVFLDGECYFGMMNAGVRPTFNEKKFVMEVHILSDKFGNLYDKNFYIEFLDKIRDEKKFDSKELLIKQIEKDKEVCIELIDTFKEKYEI